jgi:hypothetical protein
VRDAVPAENLAPIEAYVGEHAMDWSLLPQMLRSYRALQEIDVRYSDVRRSAGGFHALRRAGLVRDRLVSDAQIEHATTHPPEGTRATLRGNAVRECSTGGVSAWAGWDFVRREDSVLFLNDPFAAEADWAPASRVEVGEPGDPFHQFMRRYRRRRAAREATPEAQPEPAPAQER